LPANTCKFMTQTPSESLPNILIVDDLEENLILLNSLIIELSVNLIQAASGAEALKKIKNQELAIAILDVRMPKMNGYELAVEINKASLFGKVPIIFITAGIIDEKNLYAAYDSGAVDYLNKPFKSHVLVSKIKIFLEIYSQKKIIQNDASELKIAAQKLEVTNRRLKNSEEKFRSYIENAPDGVFVADETGRYIEVNKAACRITGYSKRELLNMSIQDILTDDTIELGMTRFKKLAKEEILSVEYAYEHKNSKPHWWSVEAVKISDVRFQCFVKDITARKMAENALKVSREKYKTMLNASPDGILLIDLKGIIREVSEIGLELLGFENKVELVGKHFARSMPSEELNTVGEIIEKTMSEGIAQNIEVRIKRKNANIFLSEISATLIQGSDGTPDSFMITIRDISQRKKLEKTQIHADRMASLGEMASGIAHEINQPLNTMSMVMDNILNESSQKENMKNEYLKNKSNKIFRNITRIRNIIDHVRAFSRSHDDYISTNFDINASIRNAVSMISEQFKHLTIDLRIQLDENQPTVLGNTFKFEQVVLNMLINAKDALLEKEKIQHEFQDQFIEIKSYRENQSFVVEVIDNGTGISEEDIEHIMLPFYTTKDTGKGTGLGLSISYQIIKEMNGSIEISGNRFLGTTFKIILNL